MNIKAEGLYAWADEMTGLLERAARPDCACWGEQLHLPGGNYVGRTDLERIFDENSPFIPSAAEIWIALANGADAEEILARIDDAPWIARRAQEAVELDSSEYFITEIQPDAFDRAWHNDRMRADPQAYCNMGERQVEALGRALGDRELANGVRSALDFIAKCSEELGRVAHESVGSEWGWNYALGCGWVSEADFDRITGSRLGADLYLLWENGGLDIDAIEMGAGDPDALGLMARIAGASGAWAAYGTDLEPGDLSFDSMAELLAERPEMARGLELEPARGDANARWNREEPSPAGRRPDYAAEFERRAIGMLALPWDPISSEPGTGLVPLDCGLLKLRLDAASANLSAGPRRAGGGAAADPVQNDALARRTVEAVGDVRVCRRDVDELANDLVYARWRDGGEIGPEHLEAVLSRFKGLVGRPVDADRVNEYLAGTDSDRIIAFRLDAPRTDKGEALEATAVSDEPAARAYAYLADIVIETEGSRQEVIRERAAGDIGELPESKWDRLDIWSRADTLAPKVGPMRPRDGGTNRTERPPHRRTRR